MFADIFSRPVALVLGLVSLLPGGILALVTVGLAADVGEDRREGLDRRAGAVVSDVQTVGGSSPSGLSKAVLVTYAAEDKRYTARLRGGAERIGLSLGDDVDVAYRADRPNRPYTVEYAESEPPGTAGQVVGVGISGLLAAFFLGASGWLFLSAGRKS